jgi:hypothetical protein
VLSDRYDQLSAEHTVHETAEVMLELGVIGPIGVGWREPVPTIVRTANTDAITVGEQVGLRLVADPDAMFNGTLVSVRPGERWLTIADAIHNGTIVPRDGSRRLAA